MRRATLLFAAVVIAACAQPTPPTPTPAAAPATPAASTPVETAAALLLQVTIPGGFCSYGGCAYFAELSGHEGASKAEFERDPGGDAIVVGAGLPATLPAGDYTLSLTSYVLSDALVAGGGRPLGPIAATCSAHFIVAPGQASVSGHGSFDQDTCSVTISG